jgi:hypothetical protein
MKRLGAIAFICAYLGALSWGTFAHAVKYKNAAHPIMYYVVWDMFCGWSAYSTRLEVIAEGESGKYYQVSPPPWGELSPFGDLERRHYDVNDHLMPELIRNNLAHTAHEPITSVYVVEEVWSKRFNLPDEIWNEKFNEPKVPVKYYNVSGVYASDGTKTQCRPKWLALQVVRSIADNPRLQRQAATSNSYFTINASNGRPMTPKGN